MNGFIIKEEPRLFELESALMTTQDIIDRKLKEIRILGSLTEKEALFPEVQRRVKNKLSLVRRLLKMNLIQEMDEQKIKFSRKSPLRINTKSKVHLKLYPSDSFTHISFKEYIQELIQSFQSVMSLGKFEPEIKTDLEDVHLDINYAIPCGLILNELITNSWKHAFPNQEKGTIIVSLNREGENIHLSVGIYEMPYAASIALTYFLFIGLINAVNLIDGIDGLAASFTAIAAIFFSYWFYVTGNEPLFVFSAILAGCYGFFLLYNWSPAKVFMGDTGALFAGFDLAFLSVHFLNTAITGTAIAGWQSSVPVILMAILILPIYDTTRIIVLRVFSGKSPFDADANHVHHHFLELGFTHAQTTSILVSINLFIVGFVLLMSPFLSINALFFSVILLCLIALPTNRFKRKFTNFRYSMKWNSETELNKSEITRIGLNGNGPSEWNGVNGGKLEYLYSQTAKKAGIEMPKTELFEGKYFGTERFDRQEGKRIHMITASGLLHASHRYPSLDYTDLMKAAWHLTRSVIEVKKLFRLMVFNVLTYNRDDHAKNFTFLNKEGEWVVSPAYDLVYSHGFRGNHSTTVLGSGSPDRETMLKAGLDAGLQNADCETIYSEVEEATRELVAMIKRRFLL